MRSTKFYSRRRGDISTGQTSIHVRYANFARIRNCIDTEKQSELRKMVYIDDWGGGLTVQAVNDSIIENCTSINSTVLNG